MASDRLESEEAYLESVSRGDQHDIGDHFGNCISRYFRWRSLAKSTNWSDLETRLLDATSRNNFRELPYIEVSKGGRRFSVIGVYHGDWNMRYTTDSPIHHLQVSSIQQSRSSGSIVLTEDNLHNLFGGQPLGDHLIFETIPTPSKKLNKFLYEWSLYKRQSHFPKSQRFVKLVSDCIELGGEKQSWLLSSKCALFTSLLACPTEFPESLANKVGFYRARHIARMAQQLGEESDHILIVVGNAHELAVASCLESNHFSLIDALYHKYPNKTLSQAICISNGLENRAKHSNTELS